MMSALDAFGAILGFAAGFALWVTAQAFDALGVKARWFDRVLESVAIAPRSGP